VASPSSRSNRPAALPMPPDPAMSMRWFIKLVGKKGIAYAQNRRKGNFLAVRRSDFLVQIKGQALRSVHFFPQAIFFSFWQKKQRLTFMVEIQVLRLLFLNDPK
jgi:hypothetical protein